MITTREEFPKLLEPLSRQRHIADGNGLRPVLVGVEVGVQEGLFSELLLRSRPELVLFLVDPWQYQANGYRDIANVAQREQDRRLALALTRLQPFIGRHILIRDYSPSAAWTFPDGWLDFVYLDGNHSHDATRADLEAWWPKLRIGGLMSGHDYLEGPNICGSEFGVVSAIKEFLEVKGECAGPVSHTPEAWPTWWFEKRLWE